MKKTPLFLLLIAMIPAAFALSGTGTDEESEPMMRMALLSGFVPQPLDCSQIGTVVAIDISKGQIPADAQAFMDDLDSAGYFVATVDLSTAEGQKALSCTDVLVIWSLSSNFVISGAYTVAEVDAIENFVTSGGGLFFLSDWGGFASSTANLISRFGIVVQQNTATDSNNNDLGNTWWPIYESDNFITSPLFTGVKGIEHVAGTSFVVGQSSPLYPVVTTDTDGSASPSGVPVVAAGFYEKGCVLVTGDTNWIQKFVDGYSKVDNAKFAMNGVDFLTTCNPGDVNVPEFGLIGVTLAIAGTGIALFVLRRRQ